MSGRKVILGFTLLFLSCYGPRSGDELATFQKDNGVFAIKSTAYTEKRIVGGALAGAHFVFETKKKNEVVWREIMVFREDDPVPINENGIQFVNDRIGYVYMGWMYAVTTDSGETWNFWNGFKHPLDKGRMGYNAIKDVKLLENGEGRMILTLIGVEDLTLLTKDYGISWDSEAP